MFSHFCDSKLIILVQTLNDCGPLALLHTELAVCNEYERIGTFSYDQEEITKLRLAQKDVILNNSISWRIEFLSRPVQEIRMQFSTSESSVSSEDSTTKRQAKQSTPHRKRAAPTPAESLNKMIRKKLHLEKHFLP